MANVTDMFISIALLVFIVIVILLSFLVKSLVSSGTSRVGRRLGKRKKMGEEDDKLGFLGSLAILGIVGILFIAFKDELVTIMPSTITADSFLILGAGFLLLVIVLVILSVK